jgi:hypothetical protein
MDNNYNSDKIIIINKSILSSESYEYIYLIFVNCLLLIYLSIFLDNYLSLFINNINFY